MKYKITYVILVIFLLESCFINVIVAKANRQVILRGQVINNKDNQFVSNASVAIKSTGKGTVADERGLFSIEVPSDTSTIIVSCIGFKAGSIKLQSSMDFSAVIVRLEEDIQLMDAVTVMGEKERIVRISENISSVKMSPKLVAKLPSMGEVDVMRSFQLLPGVSATNETSAGLFVRGGTPDQNLILFDGMKIYHVDHFYGFFSAFNANTIDDIELMKGGFPAKYGGRISSVMEIKGKPADLQHINGIATVSLLSVNGAVEVPLVKDKLSLQLAARRSYTDIIQTGLYNKIFNLYSKTSSSSSQGGPGGGRMGRMQMQEAQPEFYFYDLNSKLSYKLNDKHSLALSLYKGKDNLDNSNDVTMNMGFGGNTGTATNSTKDIAGWGNTGISSQWHAHWSPKFTTTTFVSYSNYFSNRDQSNSMSSSSSTASNLNSTMSTLEDNYVKDFNVHINNEWILNNYNTIEFGAENTYNNITYALTFNDTSKMVDKKSSGYQSAVYLQDKISFFNNKAELVLGTRETYQDLSNKFLFEPRTSLLIKPFDGFKIKSAFGRYYQLCTRVIREDVMQGSKDFWLLADGKTIPISSANHYILGLSYEKGDYLFNVEAYYKNMDGLLEYSFRTTNSFRRDQPQQDYFYKGTGVAKGIEFLVQKKYGLNTGWIAYTLSEVKNTFPELNYGKSFYASHDQPHELKAVYCRKIRNWDLSATFVYATGKPYTAPESQYQVTLLDGTKYSYIHVSDKNAIRLPDYHKLDVAISYNWFGEIADKTLSLSVFNVYNRKNIWYKQYSFAQDQVSVTNINFLGITPNLSFTVKFK